MLSVCASEFEIPSEMSLASALDDFGVAAGDTSNLSARRNGFNLFDGVIEAGVVGRSLESDRLSICCPNGVCFVGEAGLEP